MLYLGIADKNINLFTSMDIGEKLKGELND
jgi:hypothetical protein